jgi:(acyl-carrier-protein) S-malonyltransferase
VKPKVTAAFHSPLLTKIKSEFREALNKIHISDPKYPVLKNLDGEIYQNRDDIINGLVDQLDHPVLFTKIMNRCINENITDYYDVSLRIRFMKMIDWFQFNSDHDDQAKSEYSTN